MGAGLVFGILGYFLSGLHAWIRRLRRQGLPEEEEVLPPEEYVDPSETKAAPKKPPMALRIVPLLIIIGLMFLIPRLTAGNAAATPEEFTDILEARGYTAVDSTEQLRQDWRIGSLLDQSISLQSGDIRLDYCVMDTTGSAKSVYQGMTLPVTRGETFEDSSLHSDFYSAQNDELYTAKLRMRNVVIYAACTPEHRETVLEFLEAIGYSAQ